MIHTKEYKIYEREFHKELPKPAAEKKLENEMGSNKHLQIHSPMKLNTNPFSLKLKERYKKYG